MCFCWKLIIRNLAQLPAANKQFDNKGILVLQHLGLDLDTLQPQVFTDRSRVGPEGGNPEIWYCFLKSKIVHMFAMFVCITVNTKTIFLHHRERYICLTTEKTTAFQYKTKETALAIFWILVQWKHSYTRLEILRTALNQVELIWTMSSVFENMQQCKNESQEKKRKTK